MDLKWKLRWSNNAQKAYCDFESSNPTVEKSKKSFSCDFHRKGHICHQTNVTFFKQTVSCARKALQADVCGEAVGNDAAATDFERRLETKPHGGETTVRFN